ncbi:MAG: thiamine-phosphate kinase [Gemmatimonadetes bacterium]|nr:thiamine-phosphate kinase [Gemmatimonadota bacterium]
MTTPKLADARSARLGAGAEFDLIRKLLEGSGVPLPDSVRVGPGDDCAVVGDGIAISCDLSVEDVHFRRDWLEPEAIGYRAAAAALSDLAAVAAEPIGLLVAVALPDDEPEELALGVGQGIAAAARDAGAALLGGDVSRSPGPLVLDIIVVGKAPNPVLRSGARPNDEVWVTGRLGCSAAIVRQLEQGERPAPEMRECFERPRPRIAEARWLAAHTEVHAMIDLSDGLAGDAGHIAAASGVGVILELDRIPVHPLATRTGRTTDGALRLALAGGEDYELCLTVPAGALASLEDSFRRQFDLPLTRVGRVTDSQGVWVQPSEGAPVTPLAFRGFDHLASRKPRSGQGS